MLPYNYSRCAGTTRPECQTCRRREPSSYRYQAYTSPAIDLITGKCENIIFQTNTQVNHE